MGSFQELCRQITKQMQAKTPLIIAIDGPCGGGKTTLATRLHQEFPDSVMIHADDFFLQPHQRTPERLAEPGGNMDRERLEQDVLQQLQSRRAFLYHRFDCQKNKMMSLQFEPASLVIVEGSYSLHPAISRYYDLKVFLDTDAGTQLQRLAKRVPAAMLPRFLKEWIPKEMAYFQHFNIKENSDIVLSL